MRWSGWTSGGKIASASGNGNGDPASTVATDSTANRNPNADDDANTASALVENWRGDQDLLAVTRSGSGLPVGQLEIRSYATIDGEFSPLATLTGGKPLLARVPTNKGGIYFCTASPSDQSSSLASNGIVLYAIVQRAIEQGITSLGNATGRIAGQIEESTDNWRLLSSIPGDKQHTPLSNEFAWTAGVYENEGRMFAINRSIVEDQRELVDDKQLSRLFAGLDFSRVDDEAVVCRASSARSGDFS